MFSKSSCISIPYLHESATYTDAARSIYPNTQIHLLFHFYYIWCTFLFSMKHIYKACNAHFYFAHMNHQIIAPILSVTYEVGLLLFLT